MIKHIVLFKLKESVSYEEKICAMTAFKNAIESLPSKISVIRNIEVGINANPSEVYHVALYSEFETMEDLNSYATHPDHVAAGKLLAEVKESRACVDYEY